MSGDRRSRAGDAGAGGGLLVGRPFGVPVHVAPSWFVVAAVITWLFAPAVERAVPGLGAWRYAVAFAFAVLLYLSVLIHELSHSVTALRLGLRVRRITLHLMGGVSEIDEPPTPGREFLVAVAGPAVSVLLGCLGLLLTMALDASTVPGVLALQLTAANFLVGGFNLLPGLPLDGGRILAAGVWRTTGRRYAGVAVAAVAGRVLAGLLLLGVAVVAATGGGGLRLSTVVVTALVASFLWLGAGQALTAARLRSRLPQLSARSLARRALPVPVDLPLAQALARLAADGARALVVVDGGGRPVGLVEEAAVRATPLERRPWVPTGDLSRRLNDDLVVRADVSGEQLVRAMQRAPASEYLVVEPTGEVYGVLTTADVESAVTGR